MSKLFAMLIREHEHDEARAMSWWAEATDAEKDAVWGAIQSLGGDPLLELVSRFAQLGFTQTAIRSRQSG